MLQTFRGIIEQDGRLRTREQINLTRPRQVIVTLLDSDPAEDDFDLALMSEAALARDWDRPEEEEAWSHLEHMPQE